MTRLHVDIVNGGHLVASTRATHPDRRVSITGPGSLRHIAASPSEVGWSAEFDITVPNVGILDPDRGHEIRASIDGERAGSFLIDEVQTVAGNARRGRISCSGLETALTVPLNAGVVLKNGDVLDNGSARFCADELCYTFAGFADPAYRAAAQIRWPPLLEAPFPADMQTSSNVTAIEVSPGVVFEIVTIPVELGQTPLDLIQQYASHIAVIPTFDRHGLFRLLWPPPKPVPPGFAAWRITDADTISTPTRTRDRYSTSGVDVHVESVDGSLSQTQWIDRENHVTPRHVYAADPMHSASGASSVVSVNIDNAYAAESYNRLSPAVAGWGRSIDHPDRVTFDHAATPVRDCGTLAWVDAESVGAVGLHRLIEHGCAWDVDGSAVSASSTFQRVAA